MEVLIGRTVKVAPKVRDGIRKEFPEFEGFGVISKVDLNRADPFKVEFLLESGSIIAGYFNAYSIEVIR